MARNVTPARIAVIAWLGMFSCLAQGANGNHVIQPAQRMHATGLPWEHEIQVAVPASYAEGKRAYPVLWLTDGSVNFVPALKVLDADLQGKIPEMIVVAIGIPPEHAKDMQKRRVYEFTADPRRGFSSFFGAPFLQEQLASEPADTKRGGAAQFLKFVVDEVRPVLGRTYRMSNENVLYGHSGGGSFCVYTLLARPDAFSKYICGSPALYVGDLDLFRAEERYAQTHRDLKANVFFGVGEGEMTEKDIVPAWGVVSSTARMVEILSLRGYPSLRMQARVFPGATHGPAAALNMTQGLRAVWSAER